MLDDDNAKTSNWDSLRIAHCLELSLAETPKNENLLIAICHFWSNGANAFLFGHGPMSEGPIRRPREEGVNGSR
jgi:hypothetical protein